MNRLSKFIAPALAGVFACTPALADDTPYPGCYKPLRGFATSICTDTEACSTQAGIFRIVFRNNRAPLGERRLVISGTFRGLITEQPNACGGATLNHVLMDKDMGGAVTTEGDTACPIGGDGVTTLEVIETLNIAGGSGIYEGVQPGGKVTLSGTLGLSTGINFFDVTPQRDDEVCFY
jgi:hypothetical protein